RMTTTPGYTIASGTVKSFMLHKKHFHELEQVSPTLMQRLIGYMTERARSFATMKLHQEKVGALGQLAAGIAHELNNPAAAISRIADELTLKLKLNYSLTEKLLAQNINPEHIEYIGKMAKNKESLPNKKLSALQLVRAEDELNDWL